MHTYQNEKDASVLLDNAVLYPNPYITVTSHGYTKHYYMNEERLATSIGGGGWCTMSPDVISNPGTTHEDYLLNVRLSVYQTDDPFEYEKEDEPVLTQNVDINDTYQDELQYECPMRHLRQLNIVCLPDLLYYTMHDYCNAQDHETDVFYRHSDHLGSANWITDANGYAIQYMHYLPYGQLLANQAPYLYDERYKFTGKERDAETGYDYFGARFYSSSLLHWISVDPLADKYTWISPYAYTMWNPIKFVDPDGREHICRLAHPWQLKSTTLSESERREMIATNNRLGANMDKRGRTIGALNINNVFELFAHGTPNGVRDRITFVSDPHKLYEVFADCSKYLSSKNSNSSIYILYSCYTGKGDNSIGQQLSGVEEVFGSVVIAPTDVVSINEKGNEIVGNNGTWNVFYKGKQVMTISGEEGAMTKFMQNYLKKGESGIKQFLKQCEQQSKNTDK